MSILTNRQTFRGNRLTMKIVKRFSLGGDQRLNHHDAIGNDNDNDNDNDTDNYNDNANDKDTDNDNDNDNDDNTGNDDHNSVIILGRWRAQRARPRRKPRIIQLRPENH